ncbi:class I SAM-dependent methyltransferase [Actinomadura sp. DC4]|uniref:class I SAM-dependent methyltransferase n=1 Tax=Actinomadura sp. DC4 TaxID=3055069 RepID=UPI0025B21BA3|nr:class I SAM-dependent methyltransferase [Actinomadura sp. DC4]MDN3359895.1 class I SAM-dependent methyltransferase [Actinomadura sp. DC4]
MDFAEPRRDDTCLDIASGASGLAAAIRPRVRELTSAPSGALPSGAFTLVTAWLELGRSKDQVGFVRDLLKVCGGRLVLADLVRTRAGDGGHIERLRDPAHTKMRTMAELVEILRRAGGWARRLDVFTIERPVEPWLAEAHDPDRIRQELTDELDGGPLTGARPRLIGNELWFTQSWAYFAVEPVSRPRRGPAPRRR